MNQTIQPGFRSGSVTIPASKSQAHRLLICAALSDRSSCIVCDTISKDIAATMNCLNAMGASISVSDSGRMSVSPIGTPDSAEKHLFCGESGSTLRFLLPVVGALGLEAVFHMEGRLPDRPLAPLDAQLTEHGMTLTKEGSLLRCSGKLTPGAYTLPGNVSSQYISGLLLALPLLEGDSVLSITGEIESADYIAMTEDALEKAGISQDKRGSEYYIRGSRRCRLPEELTVEADWSGAAFFLCMGAISPTGISAGGLDLSSRQGDRRILDILRDFGAELTLSGSTVTVRRGSLKGRTIDAKMIPDLVPVISALAAVSEGDTVIIHAERLRLKESDRLASTAAMLNALGAAVEVTEDGLIIHGKPALTGGTIDSANDHRIAMSAAVAATACTGPVTILDAQCAEKSYPTFWEDMLYLEVQS